MHVAQACVLRNFCPETSGALSTMPSFMHNLSASALWTLGLKQFSGLHSAANIRRKVSAERDAAEYDISARVMRRFRMRRTHHEKLPRTATCCTYMLPDPNSTPRSTCIMYFPGGAHVFPFTPWMIVPYLSGIAEAAGATLALCLYPLSPESNAVEAVQAAVRAYQATLAALPKDCTIVLGGDSAGCGIAVAVVQHLQAMLAVQTHGGHSQDIYDSPVRLPDGLLLLYPWLDVSMSHPSQAEIERDDPVLGIEGLRECGRMYADRVCTDLRDPRVSPLYGSTEGMPPTAVWCGTRDILLPDSRAWVARMAAERPHTKVQYSELPQVIHGFTRLTFTAEAQRTAQEMAEFTRNLAGTRS